MAFIPDEAVYAANEVSYSAFRLYSVYCAHRNHTTGLVKNLSNETINREAGISPTYISRMRQELIRADWLIYDDETGEFCLLKGDFSPVDKSDTPSENQKRLRKFRSSFGKSEAGGSEIQKEVLKIRSDLGKSEAGPSENQKVLLKIRSQGFGKSEGASENQKGGSENQKPASENQKAYNKEFLNQTLNQPREPGGAALAGASAPELLDLAAPVDDRRAGGGSTGSLLCDWLISHAENVIRSPAGYALRLLGTRYKDTAVPPGIDEYQAAILVLLEELGPPRVDNFNAWEKKLFIALQVFRVTGNVALATTRQSGGSDGNGGSVGLSGSYKDRDWAAIAATAQTGGQDGQSESTGFSGGDRRGGGRDWEAVFRAADKRPPS